jgi:glycolate oxidase
LNHNPSNTERVLVELGRVLQDEQILLDPDMLELYSHDASEADPHIPEAVVRVRSTAEIAAVMRIASKHRVPVTPRGGGTGRSGGAIPAQGGIVLSIESMQQIKGIEPTNSIVVIEPGVVTGTLHRTVEAEGMFYPPDPNSLDSCTLAGNIAENAGGPRAFKYGSTRQYVLGMELVTADGSVLHIGRRTIKGVTGYDLTALVVGSEGTLGIVSEAIIRLVPLAAESIHTGRAFPRL